MARSIPKWLAVITGFMVCIALIRAVNGAGELSIQKMVVDFTSIQFDYSPITDIIKFFRDGTFLNSFYTWNYRLTGLTGFFTNLGNAIGSFFTTIGTLIKTVVVGQWKIIFEIIKLLGKLFELAFKLIGIGS